MADHTEQLVGTLFRVLSEEGHTEAQRALLSTYQRHATAERTELAESLFSEVVTALDEQIDTQTQVEILTSAVERLLNRFTAVVEAAPVAIVAIDADGCLQMWNDGAERMFGWRDAEVSQQPYTQVLTESPQTAESVFSRLENGELVRGVDAQHTHKNGTVLDVRLWAAPIKTRVEEFDGSVLVISDISEQKQREQRLAVLNRVLRHNIRNEINVVRGHLELLAESRPGDDEHIQLMREKLSNIEELGDTARRIEQIQDTTREERNTIDLGTMLRERVERLRANSRGAQVSMDVPKSLFVVADKLLPYAFDNVLDNAVEHNDSEVPTVEVDYATDADSSPSRVTVSVADNGPGLPSMEREVLTSETETPLKHSSGLGLWLTRWIVRNSDGSVTVRESELGGICVSISLKIQSR